MLDRDTRTAILRLTEEGHGKKRIAQLVGASPRTVGRVLRDGRAEVPRLERDSLLDPHVDRVRELHAVCRGNLARVAEILGDDGVAVPYSTLTGFCRRHGIGVEPRPRAGRYHFEPGEEMQHDTSPHTVDVGGRRRLLQCASLVLCYSRMRFARCFASFDRFACKLFLDEALRHLGGTAARCMTDNTSVVIVRGTGANAVPAAEMVAFANRYGFAFAAHEVGDANRSARVERLFYHVETNFYPGRTFTDLGDLNHQLAAWCDKVNGTWTKNLHASPVELFAAERTALKALPEYLPEVFDLLQRRVDVEGCISVHTNRYWVPEEIPVGRYLQVRETRDLIRVFEGHRLLIEHDKVEAGRQARVLPADRHRRRRGKPTLPPSPEEATLRAAGPELAALADALRQKHGGQALKALRRLHRIYLDFPTDAVVRAVSTALEYGLIDLGRIERLVIENVAGDFFRLPVPPDPKVPS